MSEENSKVIVVDVRRNTLASTCNLFRHVADILTKQPIVTGIVDITKFVELVESFEAAMVAKQGFTQTERLEIADKLRDTILSAIGYYLRAQATLPSDKQDDAKALQSVLRSFGVSKMRTATYGSETAYIKSFIQRLNAGDNVARLAKFPELTDWTTMLEEANTAFSAIYEEKGEEIDIESKSCSEIRLSIVPVYQAIIDQLEAHRLIGTAPEFATTITEINTKIVLNGLN